MEEKSSSVNEVCVGPASSTAGKASSCAGCPNQSACASGAGQVVDPAIAHIQQRMSLIKHKILVLSGKGGVGKSTMSAQLSFALAQRGFQVGLLDVDICGPSIPRMLGVAGHEVHQSASGWSPVYVDDNLAVMSIGFMLPSADDAIIWRGPRKTGLIKQFLTDVTWNELDYLIVDTPPGTSDEHISIVQYLKECGIDGAVIVTTPQEVSMADVRKELNFCKKTGIKVLGVVENMSDICIPITAPLSSSTSSSAALRWIDSQGVDCTDAITEKLKSVMPELLECSIQYPLFTPQTTSSQTNQVVGGPAHMAALFSVPYLGKVPMDSNLLNACEQGASFVDVYPRSLAVPHINHIANQLLAATGSSASAATPLQSAEISSTAGVGGIGMVVVDC